MAKLFLLAASCLLALSVGTLLVSAGEHQHHTRKFAGHLSKDGFDLYHDTIDFVHDAEGFLESFADETQRDDALRAMRISHAKMDKNIRKCLKNVPTEDEDYMHNFSGANSRYELAPNKLIVLKTAADAVQINADTLEFKPNLTAEEKRTYHGLLTKLTAAMVDVEHELRITTTVADDAAREIKYPEEAEYKEEAK